MLASGPGEVIHALLADEADERGIRLLTILDPAAGLQGLPAPPEPEHVDVLVEPDRRDELVDALVAQGWKRHELPPYSDGIPRDWVTLDSPDGVGDIDLHDRFHGFVRPAGELFQVLWDDRETVTLGECDLATPRADRHALLIALLLLRRAGGRPATEQLTPLAEACREVLTHERFGYLGRTAYRMGAADTASEFIDLLDGVVPTGRRTTAAESLSEWDQITGAGDLTSVAWLDELRRAEVKEVPGLVWHALWLTREEIAATQKGTVSPEFVRDYRIRRLKRGIRAIPHAVRKLRDER